MDYRQRYKEECQKLFANFEIDISPRCKNPEVILKVLELAKNEFSTKVENETTINGIETALVVWK